VTLPASYQTYWLTTANGAVYSFGGAPQFGTTSKTPLAKPVVGMASTPTGGGYWLVASDGGVFTFGDARFFGSTGGKRLAKPIVGMASTPTGGGYWLVASDGGVFTFGDARFFGSTGGKHLTAPVVGMSATRTGQGYFLVAADGGVFTFGSATFYGSMGGHALAYPVVGTAAMDNDQGYWLADSQGSVTPYGAANYFGAPPQPLRSPIVGISVAKGNGDPPPPGFPAGSYGYDVSGYQCGHLPAGSHTIGVVEVDGWGDTATNPCFTTEVSWAGAGLNLYIFVIYGTSGTAEPGCSSAPSPAACDYGYLEAMNDFTTARSMIGAKATVPWWLDIEQANWTASTSANSSVVMGALSALHGAGVATVGFYFSVDGWSQLMGSYNPVGPDFPAWWGGPPPVFKCSNIRSLASKDRVFIPTGPIELLQYTDNAGGYDGDYACY
jgi:hypothetical protein